jgi:hypothetical protein
MTKMLMQCTASDQSWFPWRMVCGSKMQADFDTVYDSKVDFTLG